MTEDEARSWCEARFGSERLAILARFGEMVIRENEAQNLISPATCATIWNRHLADSAQLLLHARAPTSWLDVGSGAGFPGMVIAILLDRPVTLVEPRAKRADFLRHAAGALALSNATVRTAKAEAATGQYDIISARAVANIPQLIAITRHLRHARTRMVLPRGRNGAREVQELPRDLRRMFHVEHSVTDAESAIVLADGVMT